jgi:hypothetical protein
MDNGVVAIEYPPWERRVPENALAILHLPLIRSEPDSLSATPRGGTVHVVRPTRSILNPRRPLPL